jgi:hypothetical protein
MNCPGANHKDQMLNDKIGTVYLDNGDFLEKACPPIYQPQDIVNLD